MESTDADNGDTPLHLAVRSGLAQTVSALLSNGSDPNAAGALGNRPLHLALWFDHDSIAERLLAAGANADARNALGVVASETLRFRQKAELVRETAGLLRSGGWTNRSVARENYDSLRRQRTDLTTAAIVFNVVERPKHRSGVLILPMKLGISGSTEALNRALSQYGTVSMAEAYLNSGSEALEKEAKNWAKVRGYEIVTGSGYSPARWGRF